MPTATATAAHPIDEDDCDHDGWKLFTNPSFNNEQECDDFVKKETATPTPTQTSAPTPTATATPAHPIDEDDCDHDGWEIFTNPSFNNEKECDDFVKCEKDWLKLKHPRAWNRKENAECKSWSQKGFLKPWMAR